MLPDEAGVNRPGVMLLSENISQPPGDQGIRCQCKLKNKILHTTLLFKMVKALNNQALYV